MLAVKVAELHELSRARRAVPMLLLDDVSSELDRTRSPRLFALLAELGGQVFLTTTQPELILLDAGRRDFRVASGARTRLPHPRGLCVGGLASMLPLTR